MAKLVLNDITSGYASVDTLNSNFTAIETALENTLSRDGTTPNSMTADLDMNGHRLLNLVATQGEANFAWLGTWLPNTQYYRNNLVYAAEGTELGNGLICTKDHLSGATLNADMADPTKWDVYVQRSASVGGIAGPVSSTVNYIPQWSDTTGTTLKGGIPIGSGGVQPYDAGLAATTAFAKTLLDDVDAATMRTTLEIAAGSTTVAGLVELATAAEAQALTSTSLAITPATLAGALQGANQSLLVNGYQRFPGGLVLQWGKTGSTTSGTGKVITFPSTFPTAPFVGFVIGNVTGGGAETNHSVTAISTTTMTFTNSSASTQTFFWFAIGN